MDMLFDELPLDPGPSRIAAQEEPAQASIVITIHGDPVPKARPRGRIVCPKQGKPFIHFYQDSDTEKYEQRIKVAARQVIGDAPPIDERPIGIIVRVYLRIPSSWPSKKQAAALREDIAPTARPDGDNFLKIACDGMNGIVFRDDALATSMFVSKHYSDKPRMEIEVYV